MAKITGAQLAHEVEVAYQEKWGYIWATAGELWTKVKQEALQTKYYSDPSKYSDYELGAKEGRKWIGHRVTDCSGLVKWAMKQLGVTKGIYHGSNSQFNKNCSMTAKIEPGVKIPIGALIFTGKEKGQHNHVGVLVTETCVCEAKGTTAGVVHTPLSNKKWTYYGLLKDVSYEFTTPVVVTKPVVKVHPTLRRGSKGEDVKELQTLLAKDGSNLQIDGIFGIGTMSAVKAFQKKHNLVADGIVGPKTWKELDKLK